MADVQRHEKDISRPVNVKFIVEKEKWVDYDQENDHENGQSSIEVVKEQVLIVPKLSALLSRQSNHSVPVRLDAGGRYLLDQL